MKPTKTKSAPSTPAPKPGIAAATAVAVLNRTPRAKAVEDAMRLAVLQAAEDGYGADHPDNVRAYMLEARKKVEEEYAAIDAAPAVPSAPEKGVVSAAGDASGEGETG